MMRFTLYMLTLTVSLTFGVSGCKKDQIPAAPQSRSVTPRTGAPDSTKKNVVLFLGDSLTAGYQLAKSEAYPALVGKYWRQNNVPFRARNAGVSGDTTAGVLRRVGWVVQGDVHTVFLAIGANDGLRGLQLKNTKTNLADIIKSIQDRGVKVILAGMMLPPNYGARYTGQFKQMYIDLARQFKLPIMPFLLKDVAGTKRYNLSDGIHPNVEGHKIVTANVLSFFKRNGLFKQP